MKIIPQGLTWQNHLKFFSRFINKQDHRLIGLSIILIVINIATNTVMVWIAGLPLNAIVETRFDQIPQILIVFALLTLINQGAIYALNLNNEWLAYRLVGRIRNQLFYRLLNLGFVSNQSLSRGDQLSRLNNDCMLVNQLVVIFPLSFLNHVLTILVYSGMLIYIDFRLALLAGTLLPAFYLHQRLFANSKRKNAQELYQQQGKLMGFEENVLNNIRSINSLVAEKTMSKKQRSIFYRLLKVGVRDMSIQLSFQATLTVLIYFMALIIIGTGIFFIQNGTLLSGALLSFILYIGYISYPIRDLTHLGLDLQNYSAAADRLKEVFTLQHNAKIGEDIIIQNTKIEFRDFWFCYDNNTQIFQDLNLTIYPHEKVAVVGESGVGKTTLALLLMRFYDGQRGEIIIDGHPISTFSLDSLRRQIATVWQENFLLHDTIRNNLLLAKSTATEKDMITALSHAQALDFVQRLPRGLDTVLYSGKLELSVGQYQRLSLAQALLRNTPLLILDEFTAAQDSSTEEKILNSIYQELQDKTVIIIAHRYSTIQQVDKIIYLTKDGNAIVGNHKELLNKHSNYRHAIEWQTQTKLEVEPE